MKLIRRSHPYQPSFPTIWDDFFGKDFMNFETPSVFKSHPAVNISEAENNFRIEVAAPGLKKEDIKIEIDKDLLVISYEHKEEKNEEEKGKYTKREFSYSSFKRSFNLPEDIVDIDSIDAKYDNGVLNLTIPKRKEAQPKPVKSIQIS